ncbi:MAG: hypothetical protein VKK42_25995 [Lyngbya sp.]|nr:hypothetical protein [Lyngbya sp.]
MTNVENDQSKVTESGSPSLRRTEETSQCNDYGNGSELTGSDGISNPNQSLGVSRAIGEGDCQREQLKSTTGSGKKLIDQLEDFFGGYLTYVQSHEERLKARLDANLEQQKMMKEQFENLKQSLLQLVDTNSDQ